MATEEESIYPRSSTNKLAPFLNSNKPLENGWMSREVDK
jgi:hypothetical protein